MKKIVTFILTLTLSLFLSGCSTTSSKEVVLSDPPVLTVTYGAQSINVENSTAEWNYATDGDQWKGFVSCGAHPLEGKHYATVINTNATEATLEFDVTPDKLTVQCWSDAFWGNTEVKSESVMVSDNTMPLAPGGHIYYVTATWDSHAKFNGTADYLLYIIVE